jgi:hypothetical protein
MLILHTFLIKEFLMSRFQIPVSAGLRSGKTGIGLKPGRGSGQIPVFSPVSKAAVSKLDVLKQRLL